LCVFKIKQERFFVDAAILIMVIVFFSNPWILPPQASNNYTPSIKLALAINLHLLVCVVLA
tara:strand:+ start:510 stop:692 length:183 start_codon:yes stop_codon:yes gene_type:complete